MSKTIPWVVVAACFAATTPLYAQDAAPEAETPTPAPAVDAETRAQLAELQRLLEAQKARLEALEKQGEAADAKSADLESQIAAAEEERLELSAQMMEAESDDGKKFTVFGFMDAGFGYYAFNAGDLLGQFIAPEPTFVTSNINLYFKSELTSNLEVLIETGFTFRPQGDILSEPTVINMGGTEVSRIGEFRRQDVGTSDVLTARSFNWGGVVIERAHIDYKVTEWLQVRAGRWLTPYGIWNVDHGSPVLIGTSLPQMVSSQLVPNNQTGVQIFGRVFPTDRSKLDYVLFASNGRGPTEAVLDLDGNKALGARAKYSMSLGPVDAAFGVFGYMGRYTDRQRNITIEATPDLRADFANHDQPVTSPYGIVQQYDEQSLAIDIDIRAFNFRLFGEGMIRKVEYTEEGRPAVDTLTFLANGGRIGNTARAPDFVGKAGYLFLTYDLNTDWLKEGSFLRPYVGIERIETNDSSDVFKFSLYRMGVNFHPNPYLVWKFQALNYQAARPEVFGDFWGFTTQAAVSF